MVKRLFDLVMSILGLVFLLPILIVLSIWIKLDSKGPVFFRQDRVGLEGRLFKIHKFRTMYVDSEVKGRLTVGRDARITRVGRYLRKYKIDELPQLMDVFLGQMSLVGPRPEVEEFMNEYPVNVRKKILSVRPGITDLASIEMVDENEIISKYLDYRKAYIEIIMPIKAKYYLAYVKENNLILDIKIIVLTFKKIIYR